MSTACCPPATTLIERPPTSPRWLTPLRRRWTAWREQSARRAEWRALEQLSESTRRDIGLGERAPLAPGRALWDHERGLW